MQVQNDLIMDGSLLAVHLAAGRQLLDFIGGLCKVGVTLELPVDDGSSVTLINIVVGCGKLDVA